MDACYQDKTRHTPLAEASPQRAASSQRVDMASELDAWFSVSGDMDDFIYFGDISKDHSEK